MPNSNSDTLQEIANWIVTNPNISSKIEDAIMASDPNDVPKAEFNLILKELGSLEQKLSVGISNLSDYITGINVLKNKYNIT